MRSVATPSGNTNIAFLFMLEFWLLMRSLFSLSQSTNIPIPLCSRKEVLLRAILTPRRWGSQRISLGISLDALLLYVALRAWLAWFCGSFLNNLCWLPWKHLYFGLLGRFRPNCYIISFDDGIYYNDIALQHLNPWPSNAGPLSSFIRHLLKMQYSDHTDFLNKKCGACSAICVLISSPL